MTTRSFLAAFVAVALLVCALPAAAAPVASDTFSRLGNGSAVACNVTPATVADSTFTATGSHWLIISNPSGNGVVYIGGTAVGANGIILRPGDKLVLGVTKTAVVKCYASASTTINVVGAE